MQAIITISLKDGILDPQAKAIHHAINELGFNDVSHVIVKKEIVLQFHNTNEDEVLSQAQNIAKDLLSNPVIENFSIKTKA